MHPPPCHELLVDDNRAVTRRIKVLGALALLVVFGVVVLVGAGGALCEHGRVKLVQRLDGGCAHRELVAARGALLRSPSLLSRKVNRKALVLGLVLVAAALLQPPRCREGKPMNGVVRR